MTAHASMAAMAALAFASVHGSWLDMPGTAGRAYESKESVRLRLSAKAKAKAKRDAAKRARRRNRR